MKKKILVTGASGFTGKILTSMLKEKHYNVFNLCCDITKKNELENFVKGFGPNFIIHLAAISNSQYFSIDTINNVNIEGTKNLLTSINNMVKPPELVLIPSSAYVYGTPETKFLNENSKISSSNAYGKSKIEVENICKLFNKFAILVTRPFNYTGLGQSDDFLIPKIVKHFKQKKKEIQLGNIDIIREFNDVRDICEIYVKLIKGVNHSDTVNICSNRGYTVREIIRVCKKLTGHEIVVKTDVSLKRKNDAPVIIGDKSKLLSLISEHKFRSLENTLKWMLFDDG